MFWLFPALGFLAAWRGVENIPIAIVCLAAGFACTCAFAEDTFCPPKRKADGDS